MFPNFACMDIITANGIARPWSAHQILNLKFTVTVTRR